MATGDNALKGISEKFEGEVALKVEDQKKAYGKALMIQIRDPEGVTTWSGTDMGEEGRDITKGGTVWVFDSRGVWLK